MMIEDRTNAERYTRILSRYETEAQEMEFRVEVLEIGNRTNLKPKLRYAISLINNMVMYVKDAPVEVKIKLIGSIFPEKIVFDGESYRTKNINRVLDLIYQQTNELRGKKIRKKELQNESSLVGTRSRGRTGTAITGHRILSPACLPIPPFEPSKSSQNYKLILISQIPKYLLSIYYLSTIAFSMPSRSYPHSW